MPTNQNKKRGTYKTKSAPNKNATDSVLQMLVDNGKAITKKTADKKPAKLPEPPPGLLDAVGVKEWKRVAELLSIMGVITELDTTAMLLYCDAYSDFVRAVTELTKTKRDIIKSGKNNGGQYRNPWYDVKKKAAAEMNQYSAMLGLSPHDRAKMKSLKPPPAGGGTGNEFDNI